MMVSIQVSIYPIDSSDVSDSVNKAIDKLKSTGLEYKVNSMSTIIGPCELDEGVNAVKSMFNSIAKDDKTVMTMTVSNVCGCQSQ
jgi:uncharacterized protein YqgV (UPF0045/DUF77 family)